MSAQHANKTVKKSGRTLLVTVSECKLPQDEASNLTGLVNKVVTKTEKSTGVGNENLKKRLELLHHGKFQINFKPLDNTYTATLKLKLNED